MYLGSKELLGNKNHLLLICILQLQLGAVEAFLKAKENNDGDSSAGGARYHYDQFFSFRIGIMSFVINVSGRSSSKYGAYLSRFMEGN